MAIDRVTINLPEGTAEILEKRAAAQKRSLSNFVGLLIEADLASAGLMPTNGVHREAEVVEAAKEIGFDHAIKVLNRAARRKVSA